ncbi:MAG TPA: MmgE/PrpD family protein [bacterium]|nr:MmgE/PrpD family protein [bacterium]
MATLRPTPPTSEDRFARFAAALEVTALPDAVARQLKALILDSIGVSLAGAEAPGVDAVLRAVTQWSGPADSSLYARPTRVAAPWAALANGVMATARDFDDTLDDAMLHTQPSILPATLALGEARDATGADLLAAVAAGTEMLCRMGRARRRGQEFLPTGSLAGMAAAAASARILRLDTEGILDACGIAYSQSAANVQPLREGATVKRVHAGFASKVGVLSAVLAEGGLTGAHRWLEGEFGYYNLYERGDYHPATLTDGLGTRFHLLDLSLKPYPCARDNHGAVEAALSLTLAHDLQPAQVASADISLPPNAFGVSGHPFGSLRGHPVVEAIVSAAYCVAAAICRRRIQLEDFTEHATADPAVLELAGRITVHCDPAITDPVTFVPQSVAIRLTNGRILRQTVSILRGHPSRPLSNEERLAKFHACCDFCPQRIGARRRAAIINAVEHLETLATVRTLGRLLALDGEDNEP